MSLPMWTPWRPLAVLGEAIAHIAPATFWIATAAGLLALSIHLCVHLIGPTHRTALRGWIMWRWHRRTARRFAHSVTTGDLGTAEGHARKLMATATDTSATHRMKGLPTEGAQATVGAGPDPLGGRHATRLARVKAPGGVVGVVPKPVWGPERLHRAARTAHCCRQGVVAAQGLWVEAIVGVVVVGVVGYEGS